MSKRLMALRLSLALAAALFTPSAFAQQLQRLEMHDAHPRPFERQYELARWDDRDHSRVGVFAHADRPRGWSRGRKTGWGDCDLPPGQAKKHGCRAAIRPRTRHDRDDDRWRDRDDRRRQGQDNDRWRDRDDRGNKNRRH